MLQSLVAASLSGPRILLSTSPRHTLPMFFPHCDRLSFTPTKQQSPLICSLIYFSRTVPSTCPSVSKNKLALKNALHKPIVDMILYCGHWLQHTVTGILHGRIQQQVNRHASFLSPDDGTTAIFKNSV